MVAVGFSGAKVSLDRLPGWEPDSWAYHGDDGKSYCCQMTGKNYGPHFGVGDTVGCGINFRTSTAFFTKNGVDLGMLLLLADVLRFKRLTKFQGRHSKNSKTQNFFPRLA